MQTCQRVNRVSGEKQAANCLDHKMHFSDDCSSQNPAPKTFANYPAWKIFHSHCGLLASCIFVLKENCNAVQEQFNFQEINQEMSLSQLKLNWIPPKAGGKNFK